MRRRIRIALRIEERLVVRGTPTTRPAQPSPDPQERPYSWIDRLSLPAALVSQFKKLKDKPTCNDD